MSLARCTCLGHHEWATDTAPRWIMDTRPDPNRPLLRNYNPGVDWVADVIDPTCPTHGGGGEQEQEVPV